LAAAIFGRARIDAMFMDHDAWHRGLPDACTSHGMAGTFRRRRAAL